MAYDYSLVADEDTKQYLKLKEENAKLKEENKTLGEENTFLKHLRRENEECIEQQRKKMKLLETHIIVLE